MKAPIGTPVRAICAGTFTTGDQRPYGIFSKLVCKIPEEELYISAMYAHLSEVPSLEGNSWVEVKAGDVIGKVGKSGNASDSSIISHLHLEVRVHTSLEGAKEEAHSLRDHGPQDQTPHKALSEKLYKCTELMSEKGTNIDIRFDPFYLIDCFGETPSKTEGEHYFMKFYSGL